MIQIASGAFPLRQRKTLTPPPKTQGDRRFKFPLPLAGRAIAYGSKTRHPDRSRA